MKLLLLLLAFTILLFIPYADAAEQYGISLGKTCKVMLKNNIPGCPSLEEISIPFPDNTDPKLGKLIIIDGIFQREPSKLLHPEKFYDYHTNTILWLDPPEDVRKRIKMVSIESSLPEYKTKDSISMNDYNVSFGKDRFINANCSEIKITAKNWLFMLGDAMNLLKHNCDLSFSTFDAIKTYNFTKSYQDISTSAKYKHDKWVKESLVKCQTVCKEY